MSNRRFYGTISKLYCPVCGKYSFVPRSKSQQRNKKHIKTMHCWRCNEERELLEIREKDFILENVLV